MHRPGSTVQDDEDTSGTYGRNLWRQRPESALVGSGSGGVSNGASMSAPWPWLSFAVFKDGSYTVNMVNQNQPILNKPTARPLGTTRGVSAGVTVRRRVGSARITRSAAHRASTPGSQTQNTQSTPVTEQVDDQVPLNVALLRGSGRRTPIGMTVVNAPSSSATQRGHSGTIIRSRFGRRIRTSSGGKAVRPSSGARVHSSTPSMDFSSTANRAPTPYSSVSTSASAGTPVSKETESSRSTPVSQPADNSKSTLSFSYMTYVNGAVSSAATEPAGKVDTAEPNATPPATSVMSAVRRHNPPSILKNSEPVSQQPAVPQNSLSTSNLPPSAANTSQQQTSSEQQMSSSQTASTTSTTTSVNSIHLSTLHSSGVANSQQTVQNHTDIITNGPTPAHSSSSLPHQALYNPASSVVAPIPVTQHPPPSPGVPAAAVSPSSNHYSVNQLQAQTQQLSIQPKPESRMLLIEPSRRPTVAPATVPRAAGSNAAPQVTETTEVVPLKSILKKGGGNSFSGVRWISAGSRPHTSLGAGGGSLRGSSSRPWTSGVPQGPRLTPGLQRSNSMGFRTELHRVRRPAPVTVESANGEVNSNINQPNPPVSPASPEAVAAAAAVSSSSTSRPTSAKRGVRFNMENTSVFEYEPVEQNRYTTDFPMYTVDSDQWYRLMWQKLAEY